MERDGVLRTIEPPPLHDPMLPSDALAGRAAIVTGGASGVGFAMAAGMARCGASIALVGRNAERLEGAAARIRELGVGCVITTADVRKPEDVTAAFDAAEAALGPITILANNAGSNFAAPASTMSPNAWNAITRINLDGTFFCSTEFHRRCLTHGSSGAIINNSAS